MAMEILGGNLPAGRPAAVFAGGKTPTVLPITCLRRRGSADGGGAASAWA